MAVAGCIAGTDLALIGTLPNSAGLANRVPIQAGHLVNFGAPVEQMIRLGGGVPVTLGSVNSVSPRALESVLEDGGVACMMYVISHHAVQTNQLPLATCIDLCRAHRVPVVVDAAAEEDLHAYLNAGADLVAYSGGKAFEGPTTGILVGRGDLVAAADAQFAGVARPMKVGKEDILGLVAALQSYACVDATAAKKRRRRMLAVMRDAVGELPGVEIRIVPDDAGRDIDRLGLVATPDRVRAIAAALAAGSPSIRTRSHHLAEGLLLVDPRALSLDDARTIASRLTEICAEMALTW
jgi:L-seryl-tRNA(Ser) seleniumtransferase/D-glucosaminate-6-phosphate ammonia-lyase